MSDPTSIPALILATAFPYGPAFADAITRGDYINLFAIFDLTYPRLKRTLFLGTRWGDEERQTHSGTGRSLVSAVLDTTRSAWVSSRHRRTR